LLLLGKGGVYKLVLVIKLFFLFLEEFDHEWDCFLIEAPVEVKVILGFHPPEDLRVLTDLYISGAILGPIKIFELIEVGSDIKALLLILISHHVNWKVLHLPLLRLRSNPRINQLVIR
jgi:hypothetical protein